jgi:hypothetical protein
VSAGAEAYVLPPGVDRQILRYYSAVRLVRIAAQNRFLPRPHTMMREPRVRVLAAELRAAIAAIGAIADRSRAAATAAQAAASITTGDPTP